MASLTRAASVPSAWSSRPAAVLKEIGGGAPRTIWRARASTAGNSAEPTTVRDDERCRPRRTTYDGRANTVAAASKSNAEDVAPGSWWPALRSPR